MQIKDMYTPHGVIRPDGRMVHDVYLFQVKTPTESKCLWDTTSWFKSFREKRRS